MTCKKWRRIAKRTALSMVRSFRRCEQFQWEQHDTNTSLGAVLAERCSHSSCYHSCQKLMYVFGGCTATYTTFNDLWTYNLSRNFWSRVVVKRAPFPVPKALASLVAYGDDLILFGGFSKSSPNPIHQTSTFYNELHLYNVKQNQWKEIETANSAPKLASHSACIAGDSMIVFGGSMGNCSSNEIWILNINDRVWLQPHLVEGRRPLPRYGHSQALIDKNHLLILGGCGGPNMLYSDVWLLELDISLLKPWRWHEIKVKNPKLSAPQLWCHAACLVGQNLVVLSRPLDNSRNMRLASKLAPFSTYFSPLRASAESQINSSRSQLLSSTSATVAEGEQPTTSYSSQKDISYVEGTRKGILNTISLDNEKADKIAKNSSCNSLMSTKNTIQEESTVASSKSGKPTINSSRLYMDLVSSTSAKSDIIQNDKSTQHSVQCSEYSENFKRITNQREKLFKTNRSHPALCVYLLDLSRILSDKTVSWKQQAIEPNAPDDTILYSICVGRGEVIMFGGMRSDSSKGALSPFTHTINNNVFILKPRYTI